jgi:hypothetical protein
MRPFEQVHLKIGGASLTFQGSGAEREADERLRLAVLGAQTATAPVMVEVSVALAGGTTVQGTIEVNKDRPVPHVRRRLAILHLERSWHTSAPVKERDESRGYVEALLGPGVRVLANRAMHEASQVEFFSCTCGRLVPWRKGRLGIRVVRVLAMHAGLSIPGRPCPEALEAHRFLNRIPPWLLGAPDPPLSKLELSLSSFLAAVLYETPEGLGGPLDSAAISEGA